MASTFSMNSSSYDGRLLNVYCVQKKEIVTGKSLVEYTITSKGGAHDYYSTGPTSLKFGDTLAYSCPRKSYSTHQFPAARGSVSGTIEIEHDANGKKEIIVSISTAIYTGTVTTQSAKWVLDDIPREAKITFAPDFTDVDNPAIEYSNVLGEKAESLQACISLTSEKDDIAYRDISKDGNKYTFTLTDDERNILRNAAATNYGKRDVYFFVRTKIGNNTFHNYVKKKFTVKETENTKPSISIEVTPKSTLPIPFNSLYIQGKTKVNISFTAEGKYGATISSYKAGGIGIAAEGNPAVSDILRYDGLLDVKGTVTDSRGFTNSDTKSINILPYAAPYIAPPKGLNMIVCSRCKSDGEISPDGIYLRIKCKRNYSKVISEDEQKNFCSLQYRVKGASLPDTAYSDWKEFILKNNIDTDDIDVILADVVPLIARSYVVQLRAVDELSVSLPMTFEIPTDDVTLHLPRGGKGTGIGGYCTKEGYLQIYYKVEIDKEELVDFIVEQGTADGWNYVKWRNGNAECWKSCNLEYEDKPEIDIGVIGLTATYTKLVSFPENLFINDPTVLINCEGQRYGMTNLSYSNAKHAQFFTVRAAKGATLNNCYFRIFAKGKWK